MKAHERIFVALDTPDPERARRLARQLAGHVGGLKIGLELFMSAGPGIVRDVREVGLPVFLDVKLHDIPNTVAGAAAAAARLGIAYLTVHALGGAAMMGRAREAVREGAAAAGFEPPTLLAVTLLTSLADDDLDALGLAGPSSSAVARLASLARDRGVGGVVCAAAEIAAARRFFPTGTVVVPGIRPVPARDDQARVATPAQALALGADRIVSGRPITEAPDPARAAASIVEGIRSGEVS